MICAMIRISDERWERIQTIIPARLGATAESKPKSHDSLDRVSGIRR